ncbi:DEAD/DEAH box helicase [Candidatus Daviesbacteria bacterium]|nr:DEAD/DEAH box helicase [Candidatus Daviesbacteria bacterium]
MFIRKANPSMEFQQAESHNFESFNLAQALQQNIASRGFTKPTPIQSQTIGPILQGRDVIGLATTGTGKTAAFLIPLIQKIYSDRNQQVLIIAPTRELALQIRDEFKNLTWDMKLYSAVTIGGTNINRQIKDIKRSPHVVIATPGRLKDLIERKLIHLEDYSNFVLDEVDLMVDIGFINDIKYFISRMPAVRQSLFFSATISPKIQDILRSFVADPVTISVKKTDTPENVEQDVVKVISNQKKLDQLHDLLIQDGFDKVLIFGRTKHGIEKLNKELEFRGFKVGAIHGDKRQSQRQRVLQSFKQNAIKILLATDVASRGLDIDNVTHVINYDLPQTYEDYIHRIGRTGRAGKMGYALTFIDS